ncbi:hypothetical protein N182_22690 [Sinorhizobium sp. GL2]|nr:hypothetical protein N182_22690 [Sinorhizobium sp. GL2]
MNADAKFDAAVIGTSTLRSRILRWMSAAQATAFTTLGNSTSMPSPVTLTMRP